MIIVMYMQEVELNVGSKGINTIVVTVKELKPIKNEQDKTMMKFTMNAQSPMIIKGEEYSFVILPINIKDNDCRAKFAEHINKGRVA